MNVKYESEAPTEREYLRIADVCAMLGCGRSTVIRALQDGRLTARRLGRLVLIPREAVREMVELAPAWKPKRSGVEVDVKE